MDTLNLSRGARGRRGRLTRLEQLLRSTFSVFHDAWSEELRMKEQLKALRSRIDAIESCAVADGPPPWAQPAPIVLVRAQREDPRPRR